MKLTDILPVEEWQKLAEEIFKKFDMNASVNDEEGFIIHPAPGWANEICPKIKGGEETRTVCASAHQYLMKMAQEKNAPAEGECDVGFTKFVVPIFYEGKFLGTAGGCGFLMEGNELDTFYIAKLLHLSEDEVENMAAKVKVFSESDLKEAIAFVEKRIKEILSK
ncbi:MAG: PocR ligand-binding domain-containing protein [Candidatus Desulfofervidus auxilii]|nr:PocR ligand-binding domain-containing protein [Candidatus Desulfofervidus auxilii]